MKDNSNLGGWEKNNQKEWIDREQLLEQEETSWRNVLDSKDH